jgi:hypothetical protein
MLYKEVLTWKTLQHPNVLSLVGVTVSGTQFAMISEWMEKGSLVEFVKANPDANRLKLVSISPMGPSSLTLLRVY